MQLLAHSSFARVSRKRYSGSARKRKPERARPACPVFIAYADVPAARHAMARLSTLLRDPRNDRQLQPMLWRFDQLDDPRWREMALRDAARAATLVLAMSNSSGIGANAEAWLTALTAQQRGAIITAFAFVGDDEAWTISLQQARVPAAEKLPRAQVAAATRAARRKKPVAARAA